MVKNTVYKKYFWVLLPCIIVLILICVFIVGSWTEKVVFETVKQRMKSSLSFQSASLKSTMEKYAVLVTLIARRSDITYAFLTDDPIQELPKANQLINFLAGISGAADVWIVDLQGVILASNKTLYTSDSVAPSRYFQTALEGRMGRDTLISQAGERLYILAAPIMNNNMILGAVVVRIDLEYLEQVWVLLQDPVLVTDNEDNILLSSVSPWRYQSFSSENKKQNDALETNYLVESVSKRNKGRITLRKALDEVEGKDYFQVSQYDPLLGWKVHVLTNYQYIKAQRNTAILITLLVIALIAMLLVFYLGRKQRLIEEQRSQQAFSKRLERRVRDRTHELISANTQLAIEVDEKSNAEKQLREAQEELIQAAKLVGIGQMSTALAHEYNQPLAAIRSYADNAGSFLQNDDVISVKENLQRIKMLVDKMASLTKTLRNFAHKSEGEFEVLSIDKVMDELMILLSPQAKKQKVNLRFIGQQKDISILGEQGLLSQVITNLVTNAMDAVVESENRQVDIIWEKKESFAIIQVKDSGPGIPAEIKKLMFDAFFTTKSKGSGLGLGLFIVINSLNRLKGNLRIKEESGFGAVFEIQLPLAKD